jgi:hypothetical protein
VERQSPFAIAKELDTQLGGVLSHLDLDSMNHAERKNTQTMRRLATDLRLDVRDYEYAETRAEQLHAAKVARERLKQLEHLILTASQQNVFSAIEVTELSIKLEQISTGLK